ncbi:MAG: flagellar hook-associated protein 3 [Betaproteobacteria bacterium]|nr:flagellar hook-associated protein 3 [Betaproteobacteria bacterium]
MRVSTNTVYDQGLFNMLQVQAKMMKTQEQISTGRRILSPSDDPVSSARALEVSQSKSVTDQYSRNADSATAAISLQDEALGRYTSLLQDVKTLAVNAGNGALSSNELKSLASELRGRYDELVGLANTTDSNGLYLFSGYQGTTKPFVETAPGQVAYNGDEGQRLIQIGPTRNVPVAQSGADVFQRIKDGNGTFVTAAASGNTGTGIVSPGDVKDEAAWNTAGNSKNYEIRFAVDSSTSPAQTTYDIVDTVNNVSMLTGLPPSATGPYLRTYQPGVAIRLATESPPDTNAVPFDYGVQLDVTGSPADGDTFTIAPSTNQDIFSTLNDLITALETAGPGATSNTKLTNSLNTAQTRIDSSLNVALTVRAAVGAFGKEVDTNKNAAQDLSVQFSQTLSQLQDLDYASAITNLSYQQVSLQAAQKSFLQIQQLNLFSLL